MPDPYTSKSTFFFLHRREKKRSWNTTLIIRKQLSGGYIQHTALYNKDIKINLDVEGLCSRMSYRHIFSESLFEEGAIKSILFVLVPLVTSMARATGIRTPFCSRYDGNQVKLLSFKKLIFMKTTRNIPIYWHILPWQSVSQWHHTHQLSGYLGRIWYDLSFSKHCLLLSALGKSCWYSS